MSEQTIQMAIIFKISFSLPLPQFEAASKVCVFGQVTQSQTSSYKTSGHLPP